MLRDDSSRLDRRTAERNLPASGSPVPMNECESQGRWYFEGFETSGSALPMPKVPNDHYIVLHEIVITRYLVRLR